MLFSLPLSMATLTRVSALIRAHRRTTRSRWRRLGPGDQALLTLAYLHRGERLRTLAVGFGISEATAWRRVRETIGLLAAKATGLRRARPVLRDALAGPRSPTMQEPERDGERARPVHV